MKIRIPKNRLDLKQHLHDLLFANAYFPMANTRFSSGAGFFFRIFAARSLYAAEAVGLGSALISAMGISRVPPLLGFGIGRIRHIDGEAGRGGGIRGLRFVMTQACCVAVGVGCDDRQTTKGSNMGLPLGSSARSPH